jgi:hypothetical protein
MPAILLSTVRQAAAGISFTVAEAVGPIAGFAFLGVPGAWLLVRLLQAVPVEPTVPADAMAVVDDRTARSRT